MGRWEESVGRWEEPVGRCEEFMGRWEGSLEASKQRQSIHQPVREERREEGTNKRCLHSLHHPTCPLPCSVHKWVSCTQHTLQPVPKILTNGILTDGI